MLGTHSFISLNLFKDLKFLYFIIFTIMILKKILGNIFLIRAEILGKIFYVVSTFKIY